MNLPVAGLLGWEYTVTNGGFVGMYVGALLMYAVGFGLCATGPELRRTLIRGAAIIAGLQLFPVLQLAAGIVALLVFNQIWRPEDWFGANVRGFVVTVMTGMPLGLLAFLLGGGMSLLRTAPPTEQVEDYG
jgi:hypothetical protein